MRVAIAFDNFGPYHLARLGGAAKRMTVLAVEVVSRSAEYAWDRPDIPENLVHVPLTDDPAQKHDRARLVAAIERKLAPLAPDAIAVPGWSSIAALELTGWGVARGLPVIVMSETNGWDFTRQPLREMVKRGIVAHYAAGLCTSDGQADYLAALGLPRGAIFRGYNIVDSDYFARCSAAFAASAVMPEGEGGLLPPGARGRYFLASNRFIDKKNLLRLLDAYAAFRKGRGDNPADWPLVLLGDGELRGPIEERRRALELGRHLHLPGFRQYDELPAYYATAGCFIHASTIEQWGLVVNEAMSSGLPVLVSRRAGASALVADGENGWTFDPFDTPAITAGLSTMAEHGDLAALGEASRRRIAEWGPSRFGAGMHDAAAYALNAPRTRPSFLDRRWLGLTERRMAQA